MAKDGSADTFSSSIKSTNEHFKKLFDLVPPQAYFDAESNQKLFEQRSSQNSEKGAQNGKSTKQVAKKAKFDPAHPGKTTELQQVLPRIESLESVKRSKASRDNKSINGFIRDAIKPVVPKPTNPERLVSNVNGCIKAKGRNPEEVVEAAVNGGDITDAKQKKKRKVSGVLEDMENSSNINSNTNSVNDSEDISPQEPAGEVSNTNVKLNPDQLREKLRGRIEQLKAKRLHGMTPEEYLESKKLRRKASKLKSKQKRKESKKLRLSIQKQAKNNQSKLNGVSEITSKTDVKDGNANKMVFSKFEFSEQAKKPKDRKQKKPKSYKELYEKVTQDKAKLEQLKETDAEKAKQIADKNAWKKAMDQSKGIKVKDDPVLLKRSMKKEEKLKQRSQKKWEERVATVAEQQQKRQDKRKKNIQAKKQTKVDRKIKSAKKKGRIISGF